MKLKKIYEFIALLFILSIPMQPIFTKVGFFGLAFIVCIICLIQTIKRGGKVILTSFEKMQIMLIFIMLFSLLMGVHKYERFKYVFGIIRYFIFVSCVYRIIEYNLKEEKEKKFDIIINKILNTFCLGTVLISIYILIVEPSTNGYYGRMGRYVYENYGTYITYSYNLIISLCWLIYNIFKSNNKGIKKIIVILIFLFLTYCSLLNGTKKILASITICIVGHIFLSNISITKKLLIFILAIIIGIFSYKLITTNEYLNLIIGQRITMYMNSIFEDDMVKDDVDFSTRERALMREEAVKQFFNNPIIRKWNIFIYVLFWR